ncbi:DNA polymerase III subunit gamma/tau [Patescibacteria group bacterium]|nr:MAG: DNA polymerase III subunit gamma/tau [Patescibacteria group bacterium]
MSELSLYRKYRPETFKDVLGQDHVIKVLQGALKEGHPAHAYLFVGTRGIGKTSIARILATELGASPRDIYEMDAASNTGVDNVRQLREEASVLPFESKRKVYIIDEVHMLSKGAFNAFLKLLEEPPEHVIFILATTELEKVPDTIQSRCQVFTFKKPTEKVLGEMVTKIAKAEGFTLEKASAELIALLADGSFRDALSVLQKILASSPDKKVSIEEAILVTGAPRLELVQRVISDLSKGTSEDALSAIGEAVTDNADMAVFARLLLQRLRTLLMLRYAPKLGKELASDMADSDREFLETLAKDTTSKINAETLRKCILASVEIHRASISQLPLELAVMELTTPQV